jgi:hypothetical protein
MVEKWGIFEAEFTGPGGGNPFMDVEFGAVFTYKHRKIDVDGFYDGDGVYRVRFMPDVEGEWTYTTRSSSADLDGKTGAFTCEPPSAGNHGPVGVHNTYHFQYADGTPYFQVGTTCYVWNHQGEALEAQTLKTLAAAPFNKMRMCVFPKHYTYNQNEPDYYPYEGTPLTDWDFTRFNPAHFRHLEQRVQDLMDLGIEADIIVFHPYDRWGFAEMPPEADDHYLRYLVARLAAFRNVWWSLANEFDFMGAKSESDWDRFFQIIQAHDPYQRLRSVHNGRLMYDHAKPWVTHCSIQRWEFDNIPTWREQYKKPVVIDESGYEGNIPQGWGNNSAQLMVQRFWHAASRGGYAGHGETYLHPDDVLWWSKGGVLHGESPARIAFFRQIMDEMPPYTLERTEASRQAVGNQGVGVPGKAFLVYYGSQQPARMTYHLPEGADYTVDIIDTWGMTITRRDGTVAGEVTIDLPGVPFVAVRLAADRHDG